MAGSLICSSDLSLIFERREKSSACNSSICCRVPLCASTCLGLNEVDTAASTRVPPTPQQGRLLWVVSAELQLTSMHSLLCHRSELRSRTRRLPLCASTCLGDNEVDTAASTRVPLSPQMWVVLVRSSSRTILPLFDFATEATST